MDGVAAVAPRLIAVVGPTAAGKSAAALAIAAEHGGEIVSCDSLQVYRGLDVGSAKATPAERAAVPHHMLDVVAPDAHFSAADYARLARAAIGDIHARGRLPVVVGGTGLYLRALLEGLFEGPSRDARLRERLEALAERYGDARLHRLLARVDPAAATRIPPRDRLRVVRALEVYRATGRPMSAHHSERAESLDVPHLVLGLDPGREALRSRIEARAAAMLAAGLVDEVRALLGRGYAAELRPLQAIGYRQAVAIVRGELDPESGRRDIVAATMRYAKRQRTWFRHQVSAAWFADPDALRAAARAWLAAGVA